MPTKMLLAAQRLSAPLTRIRRVKTQAKARMIRGMIRQWYSRAITAEKKMITGSAWMARKKPSEVSPLGPVCPGWSARRPKRNFCPSCAVVSTFTTTSLSQRNASRLYGSQNTSAPRANWSPTPQPIARTFIRLRSADNAQATPISTNRPARLTRL